MRGCRQTRLLARRMAGDAATPLAEHRCTYLAPPGATSRPRLDLIETIEQSSLVGRGGAGFPTAKKLRAVARRSGPRVVLANGTEGEPASQKDQVLMSREPHLVLDGAALAALAVGASEIRVGIDRSHTRAFEAMRTAIGERQAAEPSSLPIKLFGTPSRFVTGEETALVQWMDGGPGVPTGAPTRPFARGLGSAHTRSKRRDFGSRDPDRGVRSELVPEPGHPGRTRHPSRDNHGRCQTAGSGRSTRRHAAVGSPRAAGRTDRDIVHGAGRRVLRHVGLSEGIRGLLQPGWPGPTWCERRSGRHRGLACQRLRFDRNGRPLPGSPLRAQVSADRACSVWPILLMVSGTSQRANPATATRRRRQDRRARTFAPSCAGPETSRDGARAGTRTELFGC